MSDSSTLTRCPHCQTRFRVTGQQLGVAAGKVRCGNCMEVFNAREHAVAMSAASPVDSAASSAVDSEPAPAKPAPKANENRPAESQDKPIAPPEQTSPETPDEDEFLFQDNPEEDATDSHYTQSFRNDDDFSDSFLALDQGNHFDSGTDEAEQIGEVDESWADEILHNDARLETRAQRDQSRASDDDLKALKPHRDSHPEPKPDRAPVPEPVAKKPATEKPLEELNLSVDSDDVRYADQSSSSAAGPLRAPYADLRSSPVATGKGSRGWGTTLLWTLGCVFLAAFLASQLFYFQFDRLSQYEPLRPLYAAICPLVGCELPEMVDTDQIESHKLVVRSHPEEPRALLVEGLIVNQAPFTQPFPAIVLTFSNLNNDIVAQRAFKPEEYLAGDASGMTTMPEGTPVKIALELRDPGQDAVNYNLRFLPAPQEG